MKAGTLVYILIGVVALVVAALDHYSAFNTPPTLQPFECIGCEPRDIRDTV